MLLKNQKFGKDRRKKLCSTCLKPILWLISGTRSIFRYYVYNDDFVYSMKPLYNKNGECTNRRKNLCTAQQKPSEANSFYLECQGQSLLAQWAKSREKKLIWRDNAMHYLPKKAKINVFWNFFELRVREGTRSEEKNFRKHWF